MITLDGVSKVYDGDTVAIEDVSFEVDAGTTTVLVGPSGCGKTTTIRLVNRLEEVTEGTITFDGTDVQDLDPIELRRNIGYVIQEVGLFDHMTVRENVATVPDLVGWDRSRIDERVDELLELMDLDPATFADQYPRELSGGQRQRVGIARALAAEPSVMLMDEPFGALDPITRENLQDEFLQIQSEINTTILFVTHSIDEALKMGDKIAIFDVGTLVQYDTPAAILEEPANEFVEDFIGENRGLKRLQVQTCEEVMTDPASVDAGAEGPATGVASVDGGGPEPVEPDDSLQVAFSRMFDTGADRIAVVEDGERVGVIAQGDLRGLGGADR